VVAAKQEGSKRSMSSLEANKDLIRRAYDACINKRRPDLAPEFYAADYVGDIGGLFQVRGPVEFANMISRVTLTGFPDILETPERVIAEDDYVVVHHRFRGTHSGAFVGIPPTGKTVDFQAVDIYRVVDGKIVAEHSVADMLGLLRQIGVTDLSALAAPA
jgi:steroid delta-isomerase-like uncharacterized protein